MYVLSAALCGGSGTTSEIHRVELLCYRHVIRYACYMLFQTFCLHIVYTFVALFLRRHLLSSHRALTKQHLMTTTVPTCCLCFQEVENQVTLAHHMKANDKPHTRVANEVLSQVNESILANLARSFKTFKWCVT